MRNLILFIFLIFILSCEQGNQQTIKTSNSAMSVYNTFDKNNHLQPVFDRTKFDTLHSWDFGWEILEPINIAKGKKDEIELAKRLSPGQKALYFFWYLDAQVTNGGFIQFYWNDYRDYLSPIMEGLKLIGDTAMLELVNKADLEYLTHQKNLLYKGKKMIRNHYTIV